MGQLITPEEEGLSRLVKTKKNAQKLVPNDSTLAFIMRYARACHVEKKLPDSLSGFILN